MKLRILFVLLLGIVLGAGTGSLVTNGFWDAELKSQLAEKERLVTELRSDLEGLKVGLDGLQKTNARMVELIDRSLNDAAQVGQSNQTSVEKLRTIIVRLQKLQKALRAQGDSD